MRIRVQVVIEGNEDVPPEVQQVADLQRGNLQADTLGPRLAEAKELLARVQGGGRRGAGPRLPGCQGRLPALPPTALPQGPTDHRHADPVRHPAPSEPALAPLLLPVERVADLQPADRGPAGAHDPGAALLGGEVRRGWP